MEEVSGGMVLHVVPLHDNPSVGCIFWGPGSHGGSAFVEAPESSLSPSLCVCTNLATSFDRWILHVLLLRFVWKCLKMSETLEIWGLFSHQLLHLQCGRISICIPSKPPALGFGQEFGLLVLCLGFDQLGNRWHGLGKLFEGFDRLQVTQSCWAMLHFEVRLWITSTSQWALRVGMPCKPYWSALVVSWPAALLLCKASHLLASCTSWWLGQVPKVTSNFSRVLWHVFGNRSLLRWAE